DAGAAKNLAQKIQKGGVGVWGQIPMPANPQVSAAEAETLAKWILATK
ncbi:MAG: cytochrome C', partial [Betaproteobacteria bacterium]|nr:cytochrome C' [Betaproteobacteria bacterium]